MSNPFRILRTLNSHLTISAELTIFGRSAIALGFADAPPTFHSTHDVDGILPISWLEPEDERMDFWRAVQETNRELEPDGLYVTHLFREVDVILRPDWIQRRVALNLDLEKLAIYRPGTIDLILTKMARGDQEDLDDIRFMLQKDPAPTDQLRAAFNAARVPDIPEIQQLFEKAQPIVLALSEGK